MNTKEYALKLFTEHVNPYDSVENHASLADTCLQAVDTFMQVANSKENNINTDVKDILDNYHILEVLHYYADANNYRSKTSNTTNNSRFVEYDCGARARELLSKFII